MITIRHATTEADIESVRVLFREYEASIGIDLCFQGFAQELAALPGAYALPSGRLLLAEDGATIAGCIALRPFPPDACEMKRLYVRPHSRGTGIGRLLASRLIEEAKAEGYSQMVLDTLSTMQAAIALYRSLGFVEIPPYYANPIAGAKYFALDLKPALM